eukprot:m.93850 g.93850  ORF g.93850 m.93850 type:complete len:200 (+) comp15105_c0_seq2:457-1056(+)
MATTTAAATKNLSERRCSSAGRTKSGDTAATPATRVVRPSSAAAAFALKRRDRLLSRDAMDPFSAAPAPPADLLPPSAAWATDQPCPTASPSTSSPTSTRAAAVFDFSRKGLIETADAATHAQFKPVQRRNTKGQPLAATRTQQTTRAARRTTMAASASENARASSGPPPFVVSNDPPRTRLHNPAASPENATESQSKV